MHRLINYVTEELKELENKVGNGQKLSSAETQYMDVLAHARKNLLKGEEFMEEDGYSNRGYRDTLHPSYDYGNRYNSGHMYPMARKRDSMGRYSRYSMANDEMIAELREMMNNAKDDRTRQEFQSFITRMESM